MKRKFLSVIVKNSTNINNRHNHRSPQINELKKDHDILISRINSKVEHDKVHKHYYCCIFKD
jgi:hypothetical protein